MNIAHVSTAHWARDNRIFYKECRTLARNGYNVFCIIQADKKETVDNVHFVPLPRARSRRHRLTGMMWHVAKETEKNDPAVVHIHDLELVPFGLWQKLKGRKVIYDIHEDWPKQFIGDTWERRWIQPFKPFGAKLLNNLAARYFDALLPVTPEIAKNFPEHKTTMIRNLVLLDDIRAVKPVDVPKTRPVIIYAGSIGHSRGIADVISAVGLLEGAVEFWLLGRMDDPEFKKHCESLPGWQYTRYFGRVTPTEVYGYLRAADIGVHLVHSIPRNRGSLPVKCMEYLAVGLPMIINDDVPKRATFGDCALFANPRVPEDIAAKIRMLLDDEHLRTELVRKGFEMVKEKYSWESTDAKKLLSVYKKLTQ